MNPVHFTINKETLAVISMCTVIFIITLGGIFFFLEEPNITGALILEEAIVRSNFTFVEPKNITRQNALAALVKAEEDIRNLQEFNLSVFLANDTLLDAKRAFIGPDKTSIYSDIAKENDSETRDYLKTLAKTAEATPAYEIQRVNITKVFMRTQYVSYVKEQVLRISDSIPLLEKKGEEYERQRIEAAPAKKNIELAKKSFAEERYDEAEAYLREATLQLDKARTESRILRGLTKLGKNVVQRYWLPVSILLVILVSFLPAAYVKWRKKHAAQKVIELEREQETLKKLLKKAQEDYFKHQKITKQTYDILTERYQERLTAISSRIPSFRAFAEGKKPPEEKEVKDITIRFNAPAGENHGKNKKD